MTDWDKTDIIHFLSEENGYRSYLELCTPTTGWLYRKIDRSRLKRCHRLMYRAADDFDDGLGVNFRSPDSRTGDLIDTIKAFGLSYDIILVDSFHTYDLSFRDLNDAFDILTPRGAIVVHDCLPPREDLVSPDFLPGAWCGVSFIAYVDFVMSGRGLTHATVDTDYGCGVIRKTDTAQALSRDLIDGWKSVRDDATAAYRFLCANKGPLLHLVTVEEFRSG